jgi:hypothetical protein
LAGTLDDGDGAEVKIPKLGHEAFHGPVGDFVGLVSPYSEAHPAAILAATLAGLGAYIGPGPRLYLGRWQSAKLFVCITGMSGKARKGAGSDKSEYLLGLIDRGFADERIVSGAPTSGQGVVERVRDAEFTTDGALRRGSPDQRLVLEVPELTGVLKAGQQSVSILSEIIRQAWDCRPMHILRREDPVRSLDHHISILANVTGEDLFRTASASDVGGGLLNRFLFVLATREQYLPVPQPMPAAEVEPIAARLRQVCAKARTFTQVGWTDDARDLWCDEYMRLTGDEEGPLGKITARADVHPARLALVYALLDGQDRIGVTHLRAGLALWAYCDASVRYCWSRWGPDAAMTAGVERAAQVFSQGRAERVMAEVDPGGFITRKQLMDLFSRRVPATELARLMDALCQAGLFAAASQAGEGRTAKGWRRVR